MRPPRRETSRARSIIGVRVGHSTTRPCDALRRRWSGQTKRAASRERLPHSTMTRLTRITRITRSKGRAQRGLAVPSATFCCTTHFCWRVLDAEIWRALPGRQARRERWLHAAASSWGGHRSRISARPTGVVACPASAACGDSGACQPLVDACLVECRSGRVGSGLRQLRRLLRSLLLLLLLP